MQLNVISEWQLQKKKYALQQNTAFTLSTWILPLISLQIAGVDDAAGSATAKGAAPCDIPAVCHPFRGWVQAGESFCALEVPFAGRIESINGFKCCYDPKSKMICTEYSLVRVENNSPPL